MTIYWSTEAMEKVSRGIAFCKFCMDNFVCLKTLTIMVWTGYLIERFGRMMFADKLPLCLFCRSVWRLFYVAICRHVLVVVSAFLFLLLVIVKLMMYVQLLAVLGILQPVLLDAAQPNFILILADDVGYGDLNCYGHPSQEEGPIETMAKEGMKFMNWYSAESSDTASRAGLLTGRLPVRSGMYGSNGASRSLTELDSGGLPNSETTIAEALKNLGYITGMAGKWHLGINENSADDGNHLPVNHGFQHVHTNYPSSQMWECDPDKFSVDEMKTKCFKYKNTSIVQQPVSLASSTAELVNDTKEFVRQNSQGPFFFYLSLLQTHCSLFCGEEFCGKSKRGRYGDSINEMSWAVGEVLKTLKELQIDDNTLVIFLSDNGPQLELCTDGGCPGHLSGGKASTLEGGLRVPAIVRWPGKVAAGSLNNEIVSSLDVFPTLLELAQPSGSQPADDGVIYDGKSIVGVLQSGAASPHDVLFHYCADRLMAVRYGSLKFYYYTQESPVDTSQQCTYGKPDKCDLFYSNCFGANVLHHSTPQLFNTDHDPSEFHALNVSNYLNELSVVQASMTSHIDSLLPSESEIGRINPSLQPCCNPPDCICNYNSAYVASGRFHFTAVLLIVVLRLMQ